MNIENKDIIENDNSNIRDLLSKNMETQKSEVFSFFEFSENEKEIFNVNAEILKGFDLNFPKQLLWYRKYINENLLWLNPEILNKIKKSIKIKFLNSIQVVDDVVLDAKSKNDDKKKYRWVINSKTQEQLKFIDNELLPTAMIYLKKDNSDFLYFDKSKKINEIDEMFNSNVNKDGNFDEWVFSTQIIFDYSNEIDSKVLAKNNIQKVTWIDMLSQKDKEIESNIMMKYIWFSSLMVLPYAWSLWSIPSDLTDLFSDYEWTISTMKMYWLLSEEESEYIMDKSYFDNVTWFVWLAWTVFWIQWISKMPKIIKALWKLEKLWIKQSIIDSKISNFINIFKSKLFKWDNVTKQWVSWIINKKEINIEKVESKITLDSILDNRLNILKLLKLRQKNRKKEKLYEYVSKYSFLDDLSSNKELLNRINKLIEIRWWDVSLGFINKNLDLINNEKIFDKIIFIYDMSDKSISWNIVLSILESKHFNFDDLIKLKNEWIWLNNDLLMLYNNLLNNWYHSKTTFYDFIKNAPSNLRFYSEQFKEIVKFSDLHKLYKNSIIFDNKFEKVPSNYISIYHYTTSRGLDSISKVWLVSRNNIIENDIYAAANASIENINIAKIYDSSWVNPWFKRQNSVYWYIDIKSHGDSNYWKW